MDSSRIAQISRKFTREEINHLPLIEYSGPVLFIDTRARMEESFECLQGEKVLGFDTETRPAFKKGVSYHPSLVQIASRDVVFIYQIAPLSDYTPLKLLFSNPNILKVGVAPLQDVKQLRTVFSFHDQGFVDIGKMAEEAAIESHGLRNMAAAFFGVRISKKFQCSNWSRRRLDEQQIRYAATDAWMSREIYFFLKRLIAEQQNEDQTKLNRG